MTATAHLRAHALQLAGDIEPELMTGEQAAAAVEDLAVADKALGSTLMFVALRVAQTNAWQGQGHLTAADWLSAKTGVSVYEANRQLGTAKKAERLPKTKAAMKKGNLSPEQADAVADGATADPGAEDDLLGCAARDTHKKLREEAAKRKAAATDSAARERRIRARRSLRTGTDADGASWARLCGPGVGGAKFEAMIRPFEELIFRQHRAAGRRDTYENRRYDAFFLMLAFYANLASASPAAANSGDEPESAPTPDEAPTPEEADDGRVPHDDGPPDAPEQAKSPPASSSPHPPSGSPPTWSPPWEPDQVLPLPAKRPGGDNVKVIINVDHAALLRGHSLAGETCEIAGVGPISVEAVREILRDDPFLAVVVRKGRDVVNVAHHGRGLNVHQRTAIEANGLCCTNIACNRTVAIQIDHRVPFVDDPVTELDNQDPLCPICHPLKTHHGYFLEDGHGRRRFLPTGHPDNPLTARGTDRGGDRGAPQGDRTLSKEECDALEASIYARIAQRRQRAEQPTLC